MFQSANKNVWELFEDKNKTNHATCTDYEILFNEEDTVASELSQCVYVIIFAYVFIGSL